MFPFIAGACALPVSPVQISNKDANFCQKIIQQKSWFVKIGKHFLSDPVVGKLPAQEHELPQKGAPEYLAAQIRRKST
jgi:hypothetical protein